MDKAIAKAISTVIFGVGILVAGIGSSLPPYGLALLSSSLPDTAFAEWRQDRDWRSEVAAKRARGEKLDSEIRNTLMRCVCGTTFDSWKPAESYQHRAHITAAQATSGTRR
ncbi:hypothetical protein ABIC08_007700 [Bradyrhizobium sp. RT9b]|uniref:hypothetical protein n=1 Tax=unclassified Bradyrhizobium TaxID=2631580 RepID=UPI00339715B5